jgi:hypothetical protein
MYHQSTTGKITRGEITDVPFQCWKNLSIPALKLPSHQNVGARNISLSRVQQVQYERAPSINSSIWFQVGLGMNSPSGLASPTAMRRLESTTRRMVKLCNFQHRSVFFDFDYQRGWPPASLTELNQSSLMNLLLCKNLSQLQTVRPNAQARNLLGPC